MKATVKPPAGFTVGERRCCPSCLTVVVLVQLNDKPDGVLNRQCPLCAQTIPPRRQD